MKKLVFMFVAMAAISFASCTNQKPAEAPVVEDTVAMEDTAAVADTLAAPADTAAVAE